MGNANSSKHGIALLLDGLRALADDLADDAVANAADHGSPVRCVRGCGACCNQLVPVLPMEAARIRDLVATLPAEHAQRVHARTSELLDHVDAAGLRERLETAGGETIAGRTRLAADYFALGQACPFLDDGACSIYDDRPLACREYLVVSDPAHCSEPLAGGVQRVKLRGSAIEAAKQAGRAAGVEDPRRIVALPIALLDA